VSGRLRCLSFHSVKGGVGKSTLSTVAAVQIAAAEPGVPVYLIDMDLTGTSLADVLPIEAPCWSGVAQNAPINLLSKPGGFHPRGDLQDLLAARELRDVSSDVIGVPFLNDFLLFATPDWDAQEEVPIASVAWRLTDGPQNLRVLPSSALPIDLERTLPVIYDEEHAGFLEARLEYLLDELVPSSGDVVVVFDTPPTIPGLSRSVLSLAFRLSRTPKTALSEDGQMPFRLEEAELDWKAFLVATLDYQDLRAAERWLSLVPEGDQSVITPLLNRAPSGDPQQVEALVREALLYSANPMLLRAIPVEEDPSLQLFRGERVPPVRDDLIRRILGKP